VQSGKVTPTSSCPFRPRRSLTSNSEGSGYTPQERDGGQAWCKAASYCGMPAKLMRGQMVLSCPEWEATGDRHEVQDPLWTSHCPSVFSGVDCGKRRQGIVTACTNMDAEQTWYAPSFLVCWARGPPGPQRARQVASGSHGRRVVVHELVYLPLRLLFLLLFLTLSTTHTHSNIRSQVSYLTPSSCLLHTTSSRLPFMLHSHVVVAQHIADTVSQILD